MISKENAEHYTWGAGCDGWHLVRSDRLSVIQETMPPRTSEVRHRHKTSRQFFYVLSGIASIEVEGIRHRLHQQEGLEIAPGDAHQVFNETDEPLSFLVVSSPPSHGDRIGAEPAPEIRQREDDHGT